MKEKYIKFRTCGKTFSVFQEEWERMKEFRKEKEKEFFKRTFKL